MKRSLRTLFTLSAAAALMLGCAAPYQPHAGDDAARVRIRLAHNGGLQMVAALTRTVADGRCGDNTRLATLAPWVPTTTPQVGPQSTQAPPSYPRAAMAGSVEPQRSDQAEFRIKPGLHQFTLVGTLPGPRQCFVAAPFTLEAGRQYELSFAFDLGNQRCLVRGTRLDESPSRGAWVPLPPNGPAVNCS
jgi:hypothetical protein